MLHRISHRWSDKILFEKDCASQRECALEALKAGADLREANLSGIDLSFASLDGARLDGARLDGARLDGASLDGARLDGASLVRASLVRARLDGARLVRARLDGASLDGASLVRARLDGATGLNRHRTVDLLLLQHQPGPIRLFKLVTHDLLSPMQRGPGQQLKYEVGSVVEVSGANVNENETCAAGVNVATLPWCLRNFGEAQRGDKRGRIMIVEFTAADIACIPTVTDGKLRLHRCAVVGELNLDEIFALDKSPEPATPATT